MGRKKIEVRNSGISRREKTVSQVEREELENQSVGTGDAICNPVVSSDRTSHLGSSTNFLPEPRDIYDVSDDSSPEASAKESVVRKRVANSSPKEGNGETNAGTERDDDDDNDDFSRSESASQELYKDLLGHLDCWKTVREAMEKLKEESQDQMEKPRRGRPSRGTKRQSRKELARLVEKMVKENAEVLDSHDCASCSPDDLHDYLNDLETKIDSLRVPNSDSVSHNGYVFVMLNLVEVIDKTFNLHAATFTTLPYEIGCLQEIIRAVTTLITLCEIDRTRKPPVLVVKQASRAILTPLQSIQNGFQKALRSRRRALKLKKAEADRDELKRRREVEQRAYEEEKRRDKEKRRRSRIQQVAEFQGFSQPACSQQGSLARTNEWSFEQDDELLECLSRFQHLPRTYQRDSSITLELTDYSGAAICEMSQLQVPTGIASWAY